MKEVKITDIKGVKVGQVQDLVGATGVTAILFDDRAAASVSVRGGGPASRETELLDPEKSMEKIDAIVLSGGSAYGLDAGSGVMAWLEDQGRGFDVGVGTVPIVCGASLFDLVVGDPKCRPDKAMGYAAAAAANDGPVEEGNVGAGTGASVGKWLGVDYIMKSGLGTYAVQIGDLIVGAIVAVNALGDVIDRKNGNKMIAGLLNADKTGMRSSEELIFDMLDPNIDLWKGNTTIGAIVTNANLTKAQCEKLAHVAHDGFARAIYPVHTNADGDTIFAAATGEVDVHPDALGVVAVNVMEEAIVRAAKAAKPAFGLKAACDFE
ncbi:MAG: P1 family peptidase [Firmicutes bacterium]|nr:P1 family peptidase [Bacillota bacterium]